MKKMNEKGFTLVELLVTIAILGIIMIIALPQISNLQADNAMTKYKTYADTLLLAGKLYTDSYAEDMFGSNTSGCYDITYTALKQKNLIKDIKIDGSTCETYNGTKESTFVRVYKSNDHYVYDISIKCINKGGTEVYADTLNSSECTGGSKPDTAAPVMSLSPNGMSSATSTTTTLSISDTYGMMENVQIKYVWTTTPNSVSDSSFSTYSFSNARFSGKTSSPLRVTISIPQGKTGDYYLVIKPVEVRDANGNYQTNKLTSQVFKLG